LAIEAQEVTPSLAAPDQLQSVWPGLPLAEWQDTLSTLQRWLQIVGKTRLALATPLNHYWHVTLYLTARGLTTSPMPYQGRTVEVECDFLTHQLLIRSSDGASRVMRLGPRSVADFFREYTGLLNELGLQVRLRPIPSELQDTLPFPQDEQHRSYDPDSVERCWRILSAVATVLQQFRGRFIGKCSPVHFFWGAFDLACTRFSGRTAPEHPGGVPNLPDRVVRESYSHECISAGWWPGGGPLGAPAFYSYSYPEPRGFPEAAVHPAEAYYHRDLKEFVLPYDALRAARRPEQMLLDFFQTTYEAGADLGGWDRRLLETGARG
jgi:hypothetical protein